MEPREVLKSALSAVEDAEIPSDLREVAFTKAIDLLTGDVANARPPENHGNEGKGRSAERNGSSLPSGLRKIADALSVPHDQIEILFLEHDETLQVVVDPGALGTSIKERAKSVALLVAAGRQLGGWDEGPTNDRTIRSEVERLGVYDSGNYSKHMKALNAWFNVNGSGQSATYRLKYQGREYVKQLASRLVSA